MTRGVSAQTAAERNNQPDLDLVFYLYSLAALLTESQ